MSVDRRSAGVSPAHDRPVPRLAGRRALVQGYCESLSEGRNPKAETRKKAETRNPNRCAVARFPDFGFRPSFGFRVSGLSSLLQEAPVSRAFSLMELLVVIALIATLAALLLPAVNRTKESGRGAVCLSNLHQIGLALQIYVQENNNRLPFMRDKNLNTTNDLPTPDLVLSNHVGNIKVFKCPSDDQRLFESTGSSYSWNSLLNGQDADHLSALGITFAPPQIPLMFDKDKFHRARGQKKELNYLYADGHLKNLLAIEGTIQKPQ